MAINKEYNDIQLDVKFTQASTRANLVSEENISVSFGKISKYFADLHSQAFTGYSHPTHTAYSSGLYKITVDGLGHVTSAATVTGSDLPTHEHPYLPLAGGTLTGRVTTSKFLNYIVKGTGTAGADKGSGQNPRYVPAKWTFNTGQTASDGDVIIIKIPVAGHDYGVYISIDNGTTYHPVVISGSSRLTTHYGNGNYAVFTFRGDGSASSMIPLAGNTDGARVTVTGGVWQGIDYYDSGNTYDRTSQQTRIYAGGVGVFRYSICGLNSEQRMESFTTTGDASGSPTTTKTFNTSAKFSYPPVIMYNDANAAYSSGSVISNNVLYEQFPSLDMRYSCNKTSSASTGFTQYKPVFIECTFDDKGFWSITSNGFVQTFTSGKYYILVGCMYNKSVYQLAMFAQHPVYYYDGTNLTMVPFTKAEKTKLAGISEGANKTEASSTNGKIKIDGTDTTVYIHPPYTSKTSGLYKITVDSTGHVSETASVTTNDIPAFPLSIAADSGTNQLTLSASTKYKLTAGGSTFVFTTPSHPTITKSADTTSTASPGHGGTFTVVDSVTREANGHVTKINTKTITLPADSNTDTKVTQTNTTTSADYRVLLSGNANDTTETTTGRKSANLKFNPSSGGLYSFGFLWTDITGSTLDIDTLTLSDGKLHSRRFIERSSGGADNITNIPVAGNAFLLEVDLIRWVSTTDYITRQRFTNAVNGTYSYVRYCTSGTWGSWTTRKYTDTDTKVTSSANHYTPATASGGDISKSASDGDEGWGIDVVKGVTLNTDGKGHVTGINVTSGKIPANPVPSNNVTGSGTSGYLTKWNGTHTITNGPQLGSSTTTFLRNDGTWATPPGTYTHPTYTRTDTTSTASPAHGETFTAIDSVTATNGHVTAVNVKTVTLPAQYVHPGKTQTDTTSTTSPAHGGTFTVVDSVTRDTYGHVSGINVKTVTLPSDQNTDTKVKVTANTTTKGYLIASTTSPNGTAVEGIADTGVYLDTTAGGLCATNVKASSTVCANTANSTSAGGIALYSTDPETYGIMFRGTSNSGKHGYVQSDWATYFTMNQGATTRGWVFRKKTDGPVASISGAGNAVFNGSVTVGGNTTNTSGCRMEYNTSTQSLDFVFA